jgi:hypothetical protein
LREKLLSHTVSFREKIQGSDEQIPHKNGFIKILLDLEEALSGQLLDLNRLRRDKFGIFRLVDGISSTPSEQEIMLLHEEIHELIKVTSELETLQ